MQRMHWSQSCQLPTSQEALFPSGDAITNPVAFYYRWNFSLQELFGTATRCGFAVFSTKGIPPGAVPCLDKISGPATKSELAKMCRQKWLCISLTSNKTGIIPPPTAEVEVIHNFLWMKKWGCNKCVTGVDVHVNYIRRWLKNYAFAFHPFSPTSTDGSYEPCGLPPSHKLSTTTRWQCWLPC